MSDNYTPEDQKRLENQMVRIRDYMLTVEWQTVSEIAAAMHRLYPLNKFPENSIQAQLRNLRKPKCGSYWVTKRSLGHGLFEYRVRMNLAAQAKPVQLDLLKGAA